MDAIEQIRDFQKNTIGSHANKHVHLPMPAPADTLAMDDSHSAFRDVLEGVAGQAAEDQLRLAQQALAQIRESVVITETVLEEPGPRILYVNAAFTKMTGWLPNEVVGKSPRFLQGPKTTRKTLDRLRRCLTNGEAFEGEDINYKKDGSEFWIDWYIEPLRGPDDEINYWVAVQRDMTEKRQLMAQLLQAQRLEGIGLLASGIAHDLNNVLAPVLMGCEFLRTQVATDDAREFIGLVEGSAKRGAGLVRQILSFGRGISGASSTLDPRHIVHEVAKMAQATFPKRIEVIDNAPAGLWNVSVDPTQLHQVVLNLCVNARDAIDGPGKIVLGAENLELKDSLGTIRGLLAAGSYVKLSVSDSGTGMPPSVAAKIFDPFFSTKAPGKGTGLGLSTVAMIVDGLGGAIDLETGEGKGTTFSIYLPAITETADEKSAAPDELRRDGGGRRVLIADDEVAVAAIMREMLESAGYRARTAASGLEALAVAEEMRPDLAVLDLTMPGANGGEVFFDLRARFPEMPIVLISGLAAEQAEVEVPQAAAFLEKPFSHTQLLETIHDALAVR
jgi:PAS domain S-box-containing protein